MYRSALIIGLALLSPSAHAQSQCTLELVEGPSINRTAIFRGCSSEAYQKKFAEFRMKHPNIVLLGFEAHGSFSQLNQNGIPVLSFFKVVYRDPTALSRQ